MRIILSNRSTLLLQLLLVVSICHIATAASGGGSLDHLNDPELGANLEPHPDPNDEDYDNMVYIGKLDADGKRVGFDQDDNGIRYLFGTGFDEAHKDIEEKDLLVHPLQPVHDIPEHQREELLKERRHRPLSETGPKAFGHVDIHPLDGGVTPVKVVHVDPFFLDKTLVTNKEFGKFVRSTYYETEAEKFGWSFVLSSFVDHANTLVEEADPEAEHWVAVPGAYWRRPEGPESTYKLREEHPVVHVSHRDAAEYCKWVGKRLPGEREWEAAARAGYYGPKNRTLYTWGNEDDWESSYPNANLWGPGSFPDENEAKDGWRATNPVTYYPPNAMGFYDMIGNVWEWQRGGKHKARIVRGASFVDSLQGDTNHAATLGARATLHGTTTTSNVGFRCAKAPLRRTEYHYVHHDEELHGQLSVEDQFGKRDMIPQRGWEDRFVVDEPTDDDEEDDEALLDKDIDRRTLQKRKVIKPRERLSNEL